MLTWQNSNHWWNWWKWKVCHWLQSLPGDDTEQQTDRPGNDRDFSLACLGRRLSLISSKEMEGLSFKSLACQFGIPFFAHCSWLLKYMLGFLHPGWCLNFLGGFSSILLGLIALPWFFGPYCFSIDLLYGKVPSVKWREMKVHSYTSGLISRQKAMQGSSFQDWKGQGFSNLLPRRREERRQRFHFVAMPRRREGQRHLLLLKFAGPLPLARQMRWWCRHLNGNVGQKLPLEKDLIPQSWGQIKQSWQKTKLQRRCRWMA